MIPLQTVARPEIRQNALVIMEMGGLIVAGIVGDDDIHNPIRLVLHSGEIISFFANELEVVDQETFEATIYVESCRLEEVS